jgi:hypothetical protein
MAETGVALLRALPGKGCTTRLRTWVPRMPPPGWPLYGWRWARSPAPGARRRGQRWPRALLSGLLFPVTWVAWYLADRRLAGG